MSNSSYSKVEKPKPTDFDKFLPWACKEYVVDADVTIVRTAQKAFVAHADVGLAKKLSKKLSLKPKPVKVPSLVPSVSGSGDIHSSVFDKTVTSNANKVTIETVYNSDDDLVQLKFLKNKLIPRKIMQIIALTLPYHKYLTSININSGLPMESLYEISKFLPNSHITELCFDGTFLSQANYHILLTHAKLKHLSLARCTINDAIVKTITDQLKEPCPSAKILCALNLSSNKITDIGAKYLADVLRTNRQLSYLNLAGNMITDEGGISILDKLQKFPMQDKEVLEGRAGYVAYLKKRKALILTLIKELEATASDINSNKKKSTKKGKLESLSLQNVGLKKPLSEMTRTEAQNIQDKAECLADSKLGLCNEPFSPINTKSEDGVVYCLGNNTLCCLNFAYNNLTFASLQKLREVLSTQHSLDRSPRGLIKVVIEGNLMPVSCKEFEEIDCFLRSGIVSLTKHEATMRRILSPKASCLWAQNPLDPFIASNKRILSVYF